MLKCMSSDQLGSNILIAWVKGATYLSTAAFLKVTVTLRNAYSHRCVIVTISVSWYNVSTCP